LPQQLKEWFQASPRNIDIEKYKVPMPRQWHTGKEIGLHPRGYNADWKKFIEQNPHATREQTLKFLQQLENKYGIGLGY
jgi:hypothetical protein